MRPGALGNLVLAVALLACGRSSSTSPGSQTTSPPTPATLTVLGGDPWAQATELHRRLGLGEARMVGGDHVAALGRRDLGLIDRERFGKNPAAALLVEPVELAATEEKDAAQDHVGDTLRMPLRVGESQRRSP